jgi:F-type H+-transporting ATPase subunit b
MENFPHLPTLLSVGAAVIVLTWVLNRFLFKPLRAIIDERQRRSDEGRGKLEEAQATQAQRLDEARREAHEIREQALRAGRGRRDELMGQARQQAHGLIEEARAEIAADLETARHDLEAEAERLSEMITERVLGRPVGKAGEGDR